MFTHGPGRTARIAVISAFLPFLHAAEPPLTTIQDVLYKADGTRFNGYVQISWQSFEASDTSNIATQFRAVRIVDGNLSVKLVPTTNAEPAATYSAVYNSDGKVQFQETWAVPPSNRRLRIRDVRISTPANVSSGGGPIQESDVIGLAADLNSRPTEGPGYATGRVVVTNAIGELEAVSGNLNDCVRVDGSSAPCGGGGIDAPGYIDNETPSGVVDGANVTFILASQPNPTSSLALYRNGMLMKAGFDYMISGTSVQFVAAVTPQPGDTLLASYRVTAASSQGSTQGVSMETLCSAGGSTTAASTLTMLGTCVIPADTLKPGDRVEIHFDYAHTGALSGFTFRVQWGAGTILNRSAAATDAFVTGRAEAGLGASSAQLSGQSWGTSLALGATVGASTEPLDLPLTISFSGNMDQPLGDALMLTNFTVMRYFR